MSEPESNSDEEGDEEEDEDEDEDLMDGNCKFRTHAQAYTFFILSIENGYVLLFYV